MSCNCGCGGCQTKNQGPLLMEAKVKSLLSEGLTHHISNQIPLHETVYRYGSIKHLSLIKEARKLYSRNVIDLNEFDVELVKTNLGQWGLFEDEEVPLDLPMLNEAYYEVVANLGDKKTKENLDSFEEVQDFMNKMVKRNAISVDVTKFGKDKEQTIKYNWAGDKWEQVSKSDINESELDEAEFKGKDVPLNKPKRGGSKAYYVYVRDPKTKKIKKVSFGSGGLRAKIKNKEARNAFAARHKCKDKKDRTKAGYWSCNLPRYAKALGLGANMNTFW